MLACARLAPSIRSSSVASPRPNSPPGSTTRGPCSSSSRRTASSRDASSSTSRSRTRPWHAPACGSSCSSATRPGPDLSSLQTLFLACERLDPAGISLGVGPAWHPGRRPLVANEKRLADLRQSAWPGTAADQGRPAKRAPCPATTFMYSTRTAWTFRRVCTARSPSNCHCRRHAGHPVAGRRLVRPLLPRPLPPATTSPMTAAASTKMATLSVTGRADDIINVAGHQMPAGSIEAVSSTTP